MAYHCSAVTVQSMHQEVDTTMGKLNVGAAPFPQTPAATLHTALCQQPEFSYLSRQRLTALFLSSVLRRLVWM